LDAYENQDLPFEKVVEALRPAPTPSRQPFFQVMFSFHDSPLHDYQLAGTRTRVQLGIARGAKMDLNVIFVPWLARGDIEMMWEYNTDLFDETTIRTLVQQYLGVLASAVREPERRLSELRSSLADYGARQPLSEANGSTTTAVHRLFEQHALRTPHAIAVV